MVMKRAFPLFQVFAALFLAAALHTTQAAPVAGKDYVLIEPPLPTANPDNIEVMEAFSYKCPHCRELEPKLAAWIKTLPADVDVRRLPVTFNRPDWANLAKLYYTLQTMEALEKIH